MSAMTVFTVELGDVTVDTAWDKMLLDARACVHMPNLRGVARSLHAMLTASLLGYSPKSHDLVP